MGYEIAFYAVKETSEGSSRYRLHPPVFRGAISTSARAYQWEDLMFFRHAPELQIAGLDFVWLKYHQDTPDDFDDYAPEQPFEGKGVVFDPQLILTDVLHIQEHIKKHLDCLPVHHHFQGHHQDLTRWDLRNSL